MHGWSKNNGWYQIWLNSIIIKHNSYSLELNSREGRLISLNINGSDIVPTRTVHKLGVMFNNEMSMKDHVSSNSRSACPQLRNLRTIKPFLDKEAENTVSSCLDAGNSIWYGIAQCQPQYIQRTQTIVVRIVTDTRQYGLVLDVQGSP